MFSMVVFAPASSGTFSASSSLTQEIFLFISTMLSCMAWLYPASFIGPPYSAPTIRHGPEAAGGVVGATVGGTAVGGTAVGGTAVGGTAVGAVVGGACVAVAGA